jgi:cytochrome c biogenesis protein CcmG/thiol:disulfide interchange protein DsbE
VAIDFGVYAAPESFLIDAKGVIRFKHIGALTPEIVHEKLLPLVDQLEAESR